MVKTPKEVLDNTTPQIKKIITETITYEREYQHFNKISSNIETDICSRLISLIEKEVK